MVRVRGPWRVDRLRHRAVPLAWALDDEDALVFVSLGAKVGPVWAWARSHGAEVVVETRRRTVARRQFFEYLAGRTKVFDLPLRPMGTAFSRRAWQVLQEIPYGETWSYGQQARALGREGAARAVGRANGANPLPVVVPCHRVIGQSGGLVGFGGGVETKRWLLELERRGRPPRWAPDEGADEQLELWS